MQCGKPFFLSSFSKWNPLLSFQTPAGQVSPDASAQLPRRREEDEEGKGYRESLASSPGPDQGCCLV